MSEHRALVVTIPGAASPRTSGAVLRLGDVLQVLEESGHAADVVTRPPGTGRWCTAVAVSYASAGHVSRLTRLAPRTWLDAMDSWLLVNGSGLLRGRPTYALRAARDAARLLPMARVDLATYISAADRASDRGTVRAQRRLVLPGRVQPPLVRDASARRAVVVGDWNYPPNRDGLEWLLSKVLPLTDAPLSVFGPAAPVSEHPQVQVHGYVDDPGLMYARGDVHLCPVRFGAGVKRKVLQPLLAGLPVVTTAAGAHGLRPHPLMDVRDDPAGFAAAIDQRLAASPELLPAAPRALLDADERDAVLAWLKACPG